MIKKLADHTAFLASCLLMLVAYIPNIVWMQTRWFARDSYYSHGILVPFIVGYLVWQDRAQLRALFQATIDAGAAPGAPHSRWGLPLIAFGLTAHIFSSVMRVGFISGFSLWVVITGLVLHFYGSKILKAIAFPMAFLFFMLPLPEVVIVNISFRMKMFAAGIAESVIRGMGILAVREGSVIRMANAYVVVDDVCSGLRSLISLTALGSIFAYWLNGPLWKKLVLFASTVPIAITTNVCRVVFLSLVSQFWGHEAAQGIVHDASGFAVFGLAFVLLLATAKVIE